MCPFHGFTYDNSGTCVKTPFAPPNSRCRLTTFPVHEVNGFVFAYYHELGHEPDWELPEIDETGGTKTLTHVYHLKSHPQETTENVIDLSHLAFLHGFKSVRHKGETIIEGARLKTDFRFDGAYHFPLLRPIHVELTANVEIWGLGYLYVDSISESMGAKTRNWFLATPVDGETVDILVSSKVQALENPQNSVMKLIPKNFRSSLLLPLVQYEFKQNIEADFMVWENKVYNERPMLNRADGDILKFRRYATQFYPSATRSATVPMKQHSNGVG